jgi:hypothetical protein
MAIKTFDLACWAIVNCLRRLATFETIKGFKISTYDDFDLVEEQLRFDRRRKADNDTARGSKMARRPTHPSPTIKLTLNSNARPHSAATAAVRSVWKTPDPTTE